MRVAAIGAATALCAALALAACTTPAPRAAGVRITEEFAVGGGSWSSGGGITAVARLVERDGEALVCGAWTTDRQSVLSANRNEDVMQGAALFVGGERVARNLGFMRRHEEDARLLGREASCVRTGRPWQPGLATAPVGFRFPRLTFAGGGGLPVIGVPSIGVGRGDTIVFRPGPRPAPW